MWFIHMTILVCHFLHALNFVCGCRWLVNHMMNLGFSKSLSDWIGSNLKKSEEGETWAFNLEGAVQMFNSYR